MLKLFLNLMFPPKCLVCRKKSEIAFCLDCQSKINYINDKTAIAMYEGVMKKAIRLLKFHNKKSLSITLGEICTKNIHHNDFDMVIPVPLHRTRLISRGFNQCALMGKVISEKTNIPLVEDVLIRIKNTKPQFSLKKNERFNNIKGAFGIKNAEKLIGKKILLLDDIYTTGATISECKMILENVGALEVTPFTISKA